MRLLFALVLSAVLSAADYYISPSGSDSNAGTSTAAPWKTVGKVNGRSFAAGDRVLFQGGQTFTDAGLYFAADDTGSAANPITVGSYGVGRATLQPPATAHGIYIYNTAGLYLRDLILVGPGAAASDTNQKRGVFAYCDLASGAKLGGLRLENLDVSSFYEGVLIGAWHASFSGYQDALITGCLVHDNLANGIVTYGYTPSSATQQSHANLQVVGCEVTRNYGDPTLANPAAEHSGSGIIMSGTKVGLIDRCYAHHNGGGAGDNSGGGPVGIWTYASDSVVIQRSLVHDQKTTAGSADGGGYDIDGGATNATVQYCYSYGNHGPGFLTCEYTGASPLQNATWRYNISWRDGRNIAKNMAGGFHFYSGENLASELQNILIYNNLVYTEAATGGPCVTYQSGPMTGIRLWNNIFAVQGGERLVSIGSNTAAFTAQGNLWYATDANYAGGWRWGATTYTTLAAWRAAAGTPETLAGAPVGLQADPLVASLAAGAQPTSVAAMEAMTAFHLLAGSPAIDAGQDLRTAAFGSLAVGSRDFFAAAIPVGAFDIGPQEVVAAVAPGSLKLGSATYSQAEGNSGSATVTVTATRTGGSDGAVGVSYATSNGTATAGSDYTAASGTLSWADGDTAAKTFTVTVLGDTTYEASETVNLTLSGATGGATLGTPSAAVLTIANDDALPTYAVTYSANGATGGTAPAAQTKTQGVVLTLATNSGGLIKTGYSFAGWNTAADGSGASYAVGASYAANAALTLYARWTANTYAVTYNANGATGGTVPAAQTKTYAVALTLATNSGSLVKTGSTFAGWNTAADGSGTSYAVGASYTANAAVTLYAKWTLNTYVVTYNANSATGGTAPAAQTKTYGVALTLATNSGSLVRTGYAFAGWNTAADGSGTSYAAGASYTANAAVTLYARWTAATYAVTYNANGATGGTAPAAQIKTDGVALTLATNSGSLVKTGSTFAGWNTAADGSGTSYAVGASYTANAAVTLYAKWTVNTYAVTYNANSATGGTAPAVQTKTYGVALTLATNSGSLVRTGYAFAGWNTAANGSGTSYAAGASYTANAAVALYASWTLGTYTVSGTIGTQSGVTVTLTLGGTVVASAVTVAGGGYTLSGVPAGTYALTPSLAGYTFSPASTVVTVTGSTVVGQTFVATPVAGGATAGASSGGGGGGCSGGALASLMLGSLSAWSLRSRRRA